MFWSRKLLMCLRLSFIYLRNPQMWVLKRAGETISSRFSSRKSLESLIKYLHLTCSPAQTNIFYSLLTLFLSFFKFFPEVCSFFSCRVLIWVKLSPIWDVLLLSPWDHEEWFQRRKNLMDDLKVNNLLCTFGRNTHVRASLAFLSQMMDSAIKFIKNLAINFIIYNAALDSAHNLYGQNF